MFSLAGRSRFNRSFSSFLPVSIVCDVISYHGIRQTVVCGCCGKSLFIGEWWHRGGKRMPVSRFFGRLRSLGTGLRYNPVNSFTRSCWPISFDVFVFKRKEEKRLEWIQQQLLLLLWRGRNKTRDLWEIISRLDVNVFQVFSFFFFLFASSSFTSFCRYLPISARKWQRGITSC